jgi:hypothetical protein
MDSATIEKLTNEQIGRMTSSAYKEAFEDPTTGKKFIEKIEALENAPRTTTRRAGNVRGEEAPASVGFDPSFDDQPSAQPSVAAAAQPAAAVEAELPLKEHIYQPTDKNGKPCGGRQRFEYRTDAELIEKLSKAHSAASSRIRELSRNRKLEEIATAGPTAKNFKPSTEVPATMAELSAELLEQRQQNFLLSVREALNAFQLSADWAKYRSKENAESIVLAVSRAGSDPTDPQSFHAAFAQMREFLVPEIPEKIAEVSVPTPVQAAVAVIPEPAVRATRVPMASGLSFADGGDAYEPAPPLKTVQGQVFTLPDGKKQVFTARDLERMNSDLLKRLLRAPANAQKADILYQQSEDEKLARMGARR